MACTAILSLTTSGCNPKPIPTVPAEKTPEVPGVTTPSTAATPPAVTPAPATPPTPPTDPPAVVATPPETKEKGAEWKNLFDGKTLDGWEITDFGGQGDVEVKDGAIELAMGSEMTGVTWKRDFPRVNYEVSLEAKRIDGSDFFCGVVFPVQKSPCSLVLGGWGGSVVGLSSIDGQYAVENETTQIISFDTNQWYKVRLRVTPDKINVWIDDKQVVDLKTAGKEISVHPSVEISQPFGLSCYSTKAAMRNIRLRSIEPAKDATEKK
jgi:hypothetical protein